MSSSTEAVWVQSLCEKYVELFNSEIGAVKGFQAKLGVQPDATPKFHKSRSVPFAIRVNLWNGPVITSEWASPIVVVRVCGDYSVSMNQALDVDQYPLPTPEDLEVRIFQVASGLFRPPH